LSIMQQNRRKDEDGVGHTLRSSGVFRLEASRVRISQSVLKTSEGAAWMMHVSSSQRSREDEVKDGWVGVIGYIKLFYSSFAVFIGLGHKDNLVFWFGL
jgi:hypothetical protein